MDLLDGTVDMVEGDNNEPTAEQDKNVENSEPSSCAPSPATPGTSGSYIKRKAAEMEEAEKSLARNRPRRAAAKMAESHIRVSLFLCLFIT